MKINKCQKLFFGVLILFGLIISTNFISRNKILEESTRSKKDIPQSSFTRTWAPNDTMYPNTEIISGPSGIINYNDVTFTYTGSDEETATQNLVYSFNLENYDNGWSIWTLNTSKIYNNLPNGDYLFKVRAKDSSGNICPKPAERSFNINTDGISESLEIIKMAETLKGHAEDVMVSGDFAYLADNSNGLEIIDISNPSNPIKVGSYDDGSGSAYDVFVSGSYAYIADWEDGLEIIDISEPNNPIEVGRFEGGRLASGVFVIGSYAFLADLSYGLIIIDISNPSNPVEVSRLDDNSGSTYDVFVSGSYVYLASYDNGLEIIDVSDPNNPIEIGQYNEAYSRTQEVYVSGSYAYLAEPILGLLIIDISNPNTPTKVSQYNDYNGYGYGVFVSGSYAYLSDDYGGLKIINISEPSSPIKVGNWFDGSGWALSSYIIGSYAYVADGNDGLEIIDVSNPSSPSEIGQYDDDYGIAEDVFVSGSFAYVADRHEGLEIINISDPSNPIEAGHFYDGGNAQKVFISGSYAYIADHSDGLEIIDISDPSNPIEVGQFNDGGYSFGIFIEDSYAYLGTSSGGLEIIDISDPTSPTKVGQYYDGGAYYDVFINGSYAYVAAGWNGMVIIDISAPNNPIKVGEYDDSMDSICENIFISGSYAYLADGNDGLEIIDISDPNNPTEVGQYNDIYCYDIFIRGSYAYIAASYDGMQIIDISNPYDPIKVGEYYDDRGNSYGIFVSGPYAYLANYWDGLEILDILPNCIIKLQKAGLEITEIEIGDFLDIYVGDSYDICIEQIRFSSDDLQDGNPTGIWTKWYNWTDSFEDWNADSKINRWSFATSGDKEIWAEISDDIGQTSSCAANIVVIKVEYLTLESFHSITKIFSAFGHSITLNLSLFTNTTHNNEVLSNWNVESDEGYDLKFGFMLEINNLRKELESLSVPQCLLDFCDLIISDDDAMRFLITVNTISGYNKNFDEFILDVKDVVEPLLPIIINPKNKISVPVTARWFFDNPVIDQWFHITRGTNQYELKLKGSELDNPIMAVLKALDIFLRIDFQLLTYQGGEVIPAQIRSHDLISAADFAIDIFKLSTKVARIAGTVGVDLLAWGQAFGTSYCLFHKFIFDPPMILKTVLDAVFPGMHDTIHDIFDNMEEISNWIYVGASFLDPPTARIDLALCDNQSNILLGYDSDSNSTIQNSEEGFVVGDQYAQFMLIYNNSNELYNLKIINSDLNDEYNLPLNYSMILKQIGFNVIYYSNGYLEEGESTSAIIQTPTVNQAFSVDTLRSNLLSNDYPIIQLWISDQNNNSVEINSIQMYVKGKEIPFEVKYEGNGIYTLSDFASSYNENLTFQILVKKDNYFMNLISVNFSPKIYSFPTEIPGYNLYILIFAVIGVSILIINEFRRKKKIN